MKKTYKKPQMLTVILRGTALMLGGSDKVNDYSQGADIYVGDTDAAVKANNARSQSAWDDDWSQ